MRISSKNKASFSLLEMIFVITLLSIFIVSTFPKNQINNLDLAIQKINLYIKYTRYLASIDHFNEKEGEQWQKQMWTFKIQRCKESIGGIYFIIYSDTDMDGYIDKEETLLDPIYKKHLYSSNNCNNDSASNNRYVLLTDTYNIVKAEISCNDTSSIGQISFDQFGNVYTNLNNLNTYKLVNNCKISLFNENNEEKSILITPNTGYSKQTN